MSKARQLTNFQFELTAVMGRRTKFQIEDKAQLVCRAETDPSIIDLEIQQHTINENDSFFLPRDVPLEDETLLPKTHLNNEQTVYTSLHLVDQCILLYEISKTEKINKVAGLYLPVCVMVVGSCHSVLFSCVLVSLGLTEDEILTYIRRLNQSQSMESRPNTTPSILLYTSYHE